MSTDSLEFRHVGRSGLVVSTIGLGTNNLGFKLDMDASREVVHTALDAGITLFDTADSYGASEERLGELLEGQRDDVIIATKFGANAAARGNSNGTDWNARGARRYVVRSVEASLRRLRTDWIDLYQLHRPDPSTPIEETLSALDDLVRAGKVRYIGSSGHTGFEIAEAEWQARTRGFERFISAQNEYNLLNRELEADVVPALEHYGIGLLPFSPLAEGMLSGKYKRNAAPPEGSRIEAWGGEELLTEQAFDVLEPLEAFARERGIELIDVAIGGLAAQSTVVSVIAGATSRAQVLRNVKASSWIPSAEDLAELNAITPRPTPPGMPFTKAP